MNGEALDNNSGGNPWENFSTRELPSTSEDETCRFFIRQIERRGSKEKVAHFIDEKLATEPKSYDDVESFYEDNPDYDEQIMAALNGDEIAAVKQYTGTGVYGFVGINTVSRGFWDYEKLGRSTPELKAQITGTIEKITEAIPKAPSPKADYLTFRGTSLHGFHSYGVHSIGDLEKMKGQFYLEKGFTSTALDRKKSFADREDAGLWFGGSEVEIHYHIPAESRDTISLFTTELSYSPQQTEVLIDRYALCYVSGVQFDKSGHAIVDMLLLPRNLYENE